MTDPITPETPEEEKKDRKPVVLNPKTPQAEVLYTSVSAMQKADAHTGGCLAAWYFKYVEKLPDKPPSKGQIRGTKGHDRFKKYLRGEVDVLDRLERLGVERGLVPAPNIDHKTREKHPVPLIIEEHFGTSVVLTADGIPMTGYIDVLNPRTIDTESVLEITDWKFKKSIEDYGCTGPDLISPDTDAGIQMLGYGEFGRLINAQIVAGTVRDPRFSSWSRFERIRLGHVTFQTEGKADVDPVAAEATLTSIKRGWETVSRRIAPKMREAAKQVSAHHVPKNKDACNKYGGCPYKKTCWDRMAVLAAGFKGRGTKDTKAEEIKMGMLKAMSGAGSSAPKAEPIHAESAPVAAPAPAKKSLIVDMPSGSIEAGAAEQQKKYTVNGQAAVFLCVTALGQSRFASFLPIAGGAPLLVPPETPIIPIQEGKGETGPAVQPQQASTGVAGSAPASALVVGTASGTIGGAAAGAVSAPASPPAGSSPVVGPNAPAGALALVLPPDAPKSDPKLAAKVDPVPAPVVAPPAQVAPPAAAAPPAVAAVTSTEPIQTDSAPKKRGRPKKSEVEAQAAPPPAPAPEAPAPVVTPVTPTQDMGIHLYFVGSPVGVQTSTLHAYVLEKDEVIRQGAQLNCGDLRNADDKDFGFGKWKVYLAQIAREEPPPPGHYIVTPGDDRIAVVADALISMAALAVR